MSEIKTIPIIDGDIFDCDADAILHRVNCQGVMGSGVAKQVRERYPFVYEQYHNLYLVAKAELKSLLGSIQICPKTKSYTQNLIDNQAIVNMFAQDRYGRDKRHTDYKALQSCLSKVNDVFGGRSIAIPYKMSCDRGGGDWNIVDKMIRDTLTNCEVTYYRYNG